MSKLEGKHLEVTQQVSTSLMAVSEALSQAKGDTNLKLLLSLALESVKQAQELDWSTFIKKEDDQLKVKVALYTTQSILKRIQRYAEIPN